MCRVARLPTLTDEREVKWITGFLTEINASEVFH